MSVLKTIQSRLPLSGNKFSLLSKILASSTAAFCLKSCNLMSTSVMAITKPIWMESRFLKPKSVSLVPVCGLKHKGIPKLRCEYCYFALIQGQLHVFCDLHGRHKQAEKMKRPKEYWRLSHAQQTRVRPY